MWDADDFRAIPKVSRSQSVATRSGLTQWLQPILYIKGLAFQKLTAGTLNSNRLDLLPRDCRQLQHASASVR